MMGAFLYKSVAHKFDDPAVSCGYFYNFSNENYKAGRINK
jgi:hypothetical protein